MKKTFYRAGAELEVAGPGQMEGMQRVGVIRPEGYTACPKSGCPRYEKGWEIVLNMHDPEDANVARFVREGKTGCRYEETIDETGVLKFRFPAGQCPGHRPWENPKYVVGRRFTTGDEFDERLDSGARALIAATSRKQEVRNG